MKNIPVPVVVVACVAALALAVFVGYRTLTPNSPPIPPEAKRLSGSAATLPSDFRQMTPDQKRAFGMQRMGGGKPQ